MLGQALLLLDTLVQSNKMSLLNIKKRLWRPLMPGSEMLPYLRSQDKLHFTLLLTIVLIQV